MRPKNPMLTINHYQPIRYQSFYKILIKCPFIICLSYNWERKKLDQSEKKNFILTIVSNPEHSDEIKSFPALEVTIVLCAPETAETWKLHSKQVMTIRFKNPI